MRVYLDYHSTTPCDPRVVDEMTPYFTKKFGNSSAIHAIGEEAKKAVWVAASKVANAIGAESNDVYFCSGATEANNIILKGRWLNYRRRNLDKNKRAAIITSPTEHGSIIRCVEQIKKYDSNIDIMWARVNKDGTLDLEYLEKVIDAKNDFILAVSIMTANNEIGTIYDIKSVSEMCNKYGIFFHTDATQALGKTQLNVNNYHIDAMSLSSHKIYGPKGIGALYVSSRLEESIDPLLDGGYQSGYTSGTQNVPAIVGFGKACELLGDLEELNTITSLRNYMLNRLTNEISNVYINGDMSGRLPNNINISIEGVPSEALIIGMDDVIVSGGAACKSGNIKASHVLEAIKAKSPESAIRIGLGRWTTKEEIDYAVDRIKNVVKSVRKK